VNADCHDEAPPLAAVIRAAQLLADAISACHWPTVEAVARDAGVNADELCEAAGLVLKARLGPEGIRDGT
jgi:organic hydroperoxide reductase OsmC/OhrA